MECPNRELLHVDLDSSEMILSPIRLVRESKTVVDSGFHALDSGHWTPDSRYGIPDSLSVELGFQILIVGCKKSQFYSLPFGQAVVSPQTLFD